MTTGMTRTTTRSGNSFLYDDPRGEHSQDWTWAETAWYEDDDDVSSTTKPSEEDQQAIDQLKEAKALVVESGRTLAQARAAVSATKFARQFYDPGQGTRPGTGKDKGKSMLGPKGKGKSKGKREDGGCANCGSRE